MAKTEASNKPKSKFSFKSIVSRVSRFFREVRSEFKKVVWPSKKQVINNSVVVFVVVAASALIIFGLDWIFNFIFKLVLGA